MNRLVVRALVATAMCAAMVAAVAGAATSTGFYVPKPNKGALAQVSDLLSKQDKMDAALIRAMTNKSHAVWFTGGTPAEVTAAGSRDGQRRRRSAQRSGSRRLRRPVPRLRPVLGRRRAEHGGLPRLDRRLRSRDRLEQAVVCSSPTASGSSRTTLTSTATPNGASRPFPAPALRRIRRMTRVTRRSAAPSCARAQPNVSVYLDGTHSAWLGVGDIAQRLVKAGVANAQGFFLNVSNYQFTQNGIQYGTWISDCIASGNYAGCANQYWNGGPDGTAIASLLGPWNGVALSNYGVWSDTASDPALNTSGDQRELLDTGHDALRDRHEPQRSGPVAADGVVPGRAGLVQPARSRPRRSSDRCDRQCRLSTRTCG